MYNEFSIFYQIFLFCPNIINIQNIIISLASFTMTTYNIYNTCTCAEKKYLDTILAKVT